MAYTAAVTLCTLAVYLSTYQRSFSLEWIFNIVHVVLCF